MYVYNIYILYIYIYVTIYICNYIYVIIYMISNLVNYVPWISHKPHIVLLVSLQPAFFALHCLWCDVDLHWCVPVVFGYDSFDATGWGCHVVFNHTSALWAVSHNRPMLGLQVWKLVLCFFSWLKSLIFLCLQLFFDSMYIDMIL